MGLVLQAISQLTKRERDKGVVVVLLCSHTEANLNEEVSKVGIVGNDLERLDNEISLEF